MVTADMYFSETHEWVRNYADNKFIVGITQHAQELLGDLVYLELPKIGDFVKLGETVGVIESVKAASDLYAPLTGKVIEINQAATDNPSIVNSHPQSDGWLFKIELAELGQLNKLLTAEQYQTSIG